MLLDDDGKGFEAALSFVDEYPFDEQECQALQSALTHEDAQGATTSKQSQREDINERKKLLRRAGVYADSNRARNERTREVAALRELVKTLQISLQALKTREKKQSRRTAQQNETSIADAGHLLLTPQSLTMWQEIAERQQLRRQAAERENIRLKLAVERQRKVAGNLKALMRKRTTELVNECASLSESWAPHPIVTVVGCCRDIDEFQALFQQQDTAYREIDAVFEANRMASMKVSPGDVHVREGVDGKYLKFFTRKTLPFRVQETTETTWNHFKGVEKHMGYSSLYEKTAKDLDEPYTIVEDFTKEVFSNTARADVRMKQVVRRYVEADRDVVIWVSRAVPIEIKHKLFLGMAYNFRGYAITKRSNASTEGQELSELQLCSLISLDLDAGTNYDPDTLRALTHFLIIHGARDIQAHCELIENALVDRSVRL